MADPRRVAFVGGSGMAAAVAAAAISLVVSQVDLSDEPRPPPAKPKARKLKTLRKPSPRGA